MSAPCKIVTFTKEQRDEYRELAKAFAAAELAFNTFTKEFKVRNQPTDPWNSPYGCSYDMTILDDVLAGNGGVAHAYFTKGKE
jgi:hypothetical protein